MKIYIIGEKDRKQNRQMIGKAREIAVKGQDEIVLVFVASGESEYMKGYPVNQIILLNTKIEYLSRYKIHAYIVALREFIIRVESKLLVFPSTPVWREVAAALSVMLDTALLTDCVDLKKEKNELIGIRPSLDGKSLSFYHFSGKVPYLCVMKTGSTKEEKGLPCCQQVERIEVQRKEPVKLKYIKTVQKMDHNINLKDAQLIMAGGRGMLNYDSFLELRELADVYDAAVGASRPVVDQGWAKVEEQVGQTGNFVKPKVYIAFGISGAVQHLAGMKDSHYIIAVNNHKNSPIFQYCDYGIIADANSIIRNMLKIIKEEKRKEL